MYRKHWRLECTPFRDRADGTDVYRHDVFQSALLKLRYALNNGLGMGMLAGGPGCGKSYLLRTLVRELGGEYTPIVRLAFPTMTARESITWLTTELTGHEMPDTTTGNLDRVLRTLYESLRHHTRQQSHPVILIDDAHAIEDRAVFEALNWLLNMREPEECEFTMLLAGEPHLLARLRGHPALLARVPIQGVLYPLSAEETADYIEHRLRLAGVTREILEPSAAERVHELTDGVPLLINHLCELSLLVGYADRSETISAGQVETVAEELPVLAVRRTQAA